MRREREKPLEDRCVAKIEARGWQALKLIILGKMGFPDRTILRAGGRIAFLEFKRPVVGRASRQQGYWRDILIGLGFEIHFVDTDADFDRIMEKWL